MMGSYLKLVKFSHTIFALPFAIVGFTLGYQDSLLSSSDTVRLLALVLLCMVTMRSAAMAFNRYLDRDIDAKNARTATREIPAGDIAPRRALFFVLANVLLFILATYFINPICFFLSPLAVLITLGYSYTKRFTYLCHFVLGLGLALAPIGAYMAVTASISIVPIMFGIAVLFWVAGFDIIYALQDEEFDKEEGLHSVPEQFGKKRALQISRILHLIVIASLIGAAYFAKTYYGQDIGWLLFLGTGLFIALLFFQHSLVSPTDLSKVNLAFFTTNGIASVVLGSLIVLDFVF